MDISAKRTCTRCNSEFSISEFRLMKYGLRGRDRCCRSCRSQQQHERYRAKHPNARYRMRRLDQSEWASIFEQGTMTCRICKNQRALSEFRQIPQIGTRPQIKRICVHCDWQRQRERRRSNPELRRRHARQGQCRKYGITLEEFERLLAEQDGRCALCGDPFGGYRRGPAIDHDHVSGRVRGIVHSQCNVMIGMAKEDPLRLYLGIEYVLRHHPERAWHVMRRVFTSQFPSGVSPCKNSA